VGKTAISDKTEGQANHGKSPGCLAFSGSPRGWKIRTFLRLTIFTSALHNARRWSRQAYCFEGEQPPNLGGPFDAVPQSVKVHRNPIALAREWREKLASGECATRVDLARRLGVSRARVTQVLGLLALSPEALHAVAALGDPLSQPLITERGLRSILKMSTEEQALALRAITLPAAVS
jgi:hypothetical protein